MRINVNPIMCCVINYDMSYDFTNERLHYSYGFIRSRIFNTALPMIKSSMLK